MVKTYGFVQLSAQVVDEPQREESLSVAGVQTDAVLQVTHRLFVLLQLAAGVGQIGENCLLDPVRTVGVALLQSQLVVSPSLLVVLLLVVYDSQLGVNQRVVGVYLSGFLQRQSSRF